MEQDILKQLYFGEIVPWDNGSSLHAIYGVDKIRKVQQETERKG